MLDVLLQVATSIQGLLGTLKEFFADQRFKAAARGDVFLLHPAAIRTVVQHLAERALVQLPTGATANADPAR